MRKSYWVIPGGLVLVMLLLVSIPGRALAVDDTVQPAFVEQVDPAEQQASAQQAEAVQQGNTADPATTKAPTVQADAGQSKTDFLVAHDEISADDIPVTDRAASLQGNTAAEPEEPQAPAEERQAPAEERQAPAEEQQAPAEEQQAPAEEQQAPAEERQAPAEEQQAPAEERQAPAEEAQAPAKEQQAPAEERQAPAKEQQTPAEERQAPAEEQQTPAEERQAPAEEQQAPAEEQQTPAEEQQAQPEKECPVNVKMPVQGAIPEPVVKPLKSGDTVHTAKEAAVTAKSNISAAAGTQWAPVRTAAESKPNRRGESVNPYKTQDNTGYVVQAGDTLRKISEKTGVPADRIKKVNRLDVDIDQEPSEKTKPRVTYRVRQGESLWLIGRNLGVAYQEIMQANSLSDHLIYPDQELVIPGLESPSGILNYRIKEGDTLYFIGLALGVCYEDIMALNGLQDTWIYPDEELRIPDKSSSTLYRVQEGDTLTGVAGKFDVGVSDIQGYEVSEEGLFVGQVLVIPKAQAVSRGSLSTRAAIAAESDLELLARAIFGEARGEVYEGQVAVGAVIMNRLKNAAFPKTIRGIIYQPGAFEAVQDGQINLKPNSTAYRAAKEALDGADPSLGALYYWNPDRATSKWIWTRPIVKQIGKHVFAK